MASPTNTAKKGRLLLIKVSTGASPEVYNTLLGVRSRSISINNEMVDITDDQTAPFRALLADAGLRTITMTMSGIAKDDEAYQKIQDNAHSAIVESYLVQFPNGDLLEGEFHLSTLDESGEYNAAQEFSITLESAGRWDFSRSL